MTPARPASARALHHAVRLTVEDVSSRRLLGAHLPAASPQRRETVSGECLGCRSRFAIDVRLPLPVKCPDCGDDVRARADIEAPGTQPRLPLGPPRIRGGKR